MEAILRKEKKITADLTMKAEDFDAVMRRALKVPPKPTTKSKKKSHPRDK